MLPNLKRTHYRQNRNYETPMLNVILNTRSSKANASTSGKNVTSPGFNCSYTVTVKCSCCNMKTENLYIFPYFWKEKKIQEKTDVLTVWRSTLQFDITACMGNRIIEFCDGVTKFCVTLSGKTGSISRLLHILNEICKMWWMCPITFLGNAVSLAL